MTDLTVKTKYRPATKKHGPYIEATDSLGNYARLDLSNIHHKAAMMLCPAGQFLMGSYDSAHTGNYFLASQPARGLQKEPNTLKHTQDT